MFLDLEASGIVAPIIDESSENVSPVAIPKDPRLGAL